MRLPINQILKFCLLAVFFLVSLIVSAQNTVYPNDCYWGNLTDYQQSWIANDGGTPATHIPHSIRSIFVRNDGTVATICEWDEGLTNVGIFKDNALICVPEQSGTGSWGRYSGNEVVLDDQYVYQLMRFNGNSGNDNLNANGLRAYPPKSTGIEWNLITRYSVTTGKSATFPLGYGPLNNMLLISRESSRQAAGLAITSDKLIVAVPGIASLSIPDSIKIYDKITMSSTPIMGFQVKTGGVGYLSADKKGFIWMRQGQKIVPINISNGSIRQQSIITLPDSVDMKSFSVDTRSGQERILIANSGKDLNILIYTNIYTAPILSGTFGQKGGILTKTEKFVQGQVGKMRMEGPTGVGVDMNGNIYISNMFVNATGATLHSYNESAHTFNWKKEGLVFAATADFDNTRNDIVYCPERVYKFDYAKKGQRLDSLVASTVNPFAYPNDMRLRLNPIKCAPFKRKINNKDYLFVSDMYSNELAGYRFTDSTGYIGIPFMRTEYKGFSFWNDKNGDGKEQTNEITITKPGNSFSQFVDKKGNIWFADRNLPCSFRVWRVIGETNGILQYGSEVTYKLPTYITDVQRVIYDVDTDELYVTGYTTTNPIPNSDIFGQVGTTIFKYKNISEKLASNQASETWQYDLKLLIPWTTNSVQGQAYASAINKVVKSLTVAGDYIFCFMQQNGLINLYNRETGDYAGQISPTEVVGNASGWTDFTYAINARKNADGTYEILGEEDHDSKIVHYMINSMSNTLTIKGDLAPSTITVLNNLDQTVDIQNLRSGDSIKFDIVVKNLEKGFVTNSRRSDPTRCIVQFKVTNTNTGAVVYTALSKPRQTDIIREEEFHMGVDLDTYHPWACTVGYYKLDIDVNYQLKGTECNQTNNTASLSLGEIKSSTGLDQIQSGISIFPNPVSSILNINLDEQDTECFVRLISLEGKEVLVQRLKNPTFSNINVSQYPAGVYLLNVTTSTRNYRKMIVIEK